MSWSQRYPQLNAADLHHRFSRLITVGTIAEADYETARVKVTVGEWITTWLPWITARASNDVDWWSMEVGEQVLVLSPCGDMAQAVVIGSVYQGQQQNVVEDIDPEQRQNIHRIQYQDGTIIEYDRLNHKLKADVKGDVELIVAQNLRAEVTGDVDIVVQGKLTADIAKDASIKAKTLVLETTGDMTLKAGGTMKLDAEHIAAQEN